MNSTNSLLDDLMTRLNKGLEDSNITLDAKTLGFQGINDLFGALLNVDSLAIKGIKDITLTNGTLSLNPVDSNKGMAIEIYGFSISCIIIHFSEINNQLRLQFSTNQQSFTLDSLVKSNFIPSSETAYPNLKLPQVVFSFDSGYTSNSTSKDESVIPSFSFESKIAGDSLSFPISVGNQVLQYSTIVDSRNLKRYSLKVNCQVKLPTQKLINASISLPLGAYSWVFNIDEGQQMINLADFCSIFGTIINQKSLDLKSMLPTSLADIVDNIGIQFFIIQFDDKLGFSSASFTITTGKPWSILKDNIIINKDLSISLTFSFDSSNSLMTSGWISGSATLCKNIKTSVNVPIPITSGALIVQSTDSIQLSSLTNLQDLIPGYDLTTILPKELFKDIQSLTITNMGLDLSLTPSVVINLFNFTITSTAPWMLPCNTSLDEVKLDLTIEKNSTGQYDVLTEITAIFNFGTLNNAVVMSLTKTSQDNNWKFNLQSENIILPDLGEFVDFMGGESLDKLLPSNSSNLSNLVISSLSLNFIGAQLSDFAFSATYSSDEVASPWEIMPGILSLEEFSLDFSLFTDTEGKKVISSDITGSMNIDGVYVSLVSTYDKGNWIFNGSFNTTISLTQIAKKWEIDDAIVPTIKVELKSPSIYFDNSTKLLLFTSGFESEAELLVTAIASAAPSTKKYLIAIGFNKNFSPFAGLVSLLGNDFKQALDLNVSDLLFLGTTDIITDSEVLSIKAASPAAHFSLPKQINKGISATGNLKVESDLMPFNIQG